MCLVFAKHSVDVSIIVKKLKFYIFRHVNLLLESFFLTFSRVMLLKSAMLMLFDKVSSSAKTFFSWRFYLKRSYRRTKSCQSLLSRKRILHHQIWVCDIFMALIRKLVASSSILLRHASLNKGCRVCHYSFNCWILNGTLYKLNWASSLSRHRRKTIGKDHIRFLF